MCNYLLLPVDMAGGEELKGLSKYFNGSTMTGRANVSTDYDKGVMNDFYLCLIITKRTNKSYIIYEYIFIWKFIIPEKRH